MAAEVKSARLQEIIAVYRQGLSASMDAEIGRRHLVRGGCPGLNCLSLCVVAGTWSVESTCQRSWAASQQVTAAALPSPLAETITRFAGTGAGAGRVKAAR